VPFPGGGYEDCVDLFFFQKIVPGIGGTGVDLGLFFSGFGDGGFCAGEHIIVDVADGDYVDVVAAEQEV